MPAFPNAAVHDEARATIRAHIECLLRSDAVAAQVNRRLSTKGQHSPWARGSDASAGCSKEGRDGWRSNRSRPESP